METNKDILVQRYTLARNTIARQSQDESLYLHEAWIQAVVVCDTIEDIFPQLRTLTLLWNSRAAKWELKYNGKVMQFDELAAAVAQLTKIIEEMK